MSDHDSKLLDFSKWLPTLQSEQIWEYERCSKEAVSDLAHAAYLSLQNPVDFPPLEAAIVPGDRVALAVDPNTPSSVEIVRGVVRAIRETEAGEVDVVLWDEADDQTMAALQHEMGESTRVVRHESSDRSDLRYLGADLDADPVYLNRRLVDADLVLPIAVGRPLDTHAAYDLTGIFPSFLDAASRGRYRRGTFAKRHAEDEVQAHAVEPRWWLGVQMMMSAQMNDHGQVCELLSGTPDAIKKRMTPARPESSEFPPPAPLVVASLDGGAQQQSWANAARALAAATRYAAAGGTIVLWSEIEHRPSGCMLKLGGEDPTDFDAIIESPVDENEFPSWDPTNQIARIIQRVSSEHRVLIHSRLSAEDVESIGLAVIETDEELARLSGDFPQCGVLRAAQFAGTTMDSETS